LTSKVNISLVQSAGERYTIAYASQTVAWEAFMDGYLKCNHYRL